MTEQQTPKLAASLVEHQNSFSEMSTEDAQWVIQNTVAAIAIFVAAVAGRTKEIVSSFLSIGNRTVEQLVADGKYNWSNSNLNSTNFPPSGGSGETKWEWKLFHFNKDISSEEADRRIVAEDSSNPWQSAGVEHLLSFGVKYPEEQRKFPIVGLGSSCVLVGYRHVPYLVGSSARRHAHLDRWVGVWHARYRFLAVRKVL